MKPSWWLRRRSAGVKLVGQIAKIKGCCVIGIAGGEQKCQYVKEELGFDACLDHRQPDLAERLKAACPSGIDIYFENVGGPVFDAVLPLLNNFARIPVCGLIAHYNAAELPAGPNRVPLVMHSILVKRLTFRGFIVWDFASQYPDFLRDMSGWLREGRVKYREDITDGLENAPRELIGLLKGENFGKKVIRVGPDPDKAGTAREVMKTMHGAAEVRSSTEPYRWAAATPRPRLASLSNGPTASA